MSQVLKVSPAVLDAIADGVVERLAVRAAAIRSLPSVIGSSTEYPGEPLTRRELDVLTLIADGLTNDEIGRRLGISGDTVKNHVVALLAKMNARARTQAVAIGMRTGIIR